MPRPAPRRPRRLLRVTPSGTGNGVSGSRSTASKRGDGGIGACLFMELAEERRTASGSALDAGERRRAAPAAKRPDLSAFEESRLDAVADRNGTGKAP